MLHEPLSPEEADYSLPSGNPKLSAEDPRIITWYRNMRIAVFVPLLISAFLTLYVLIQVPWDTTITLNERNSGTPFGLPIFALLIWPLAYVGLFIVTLRDKPKPTPHWEYYFGRWAIYPGTLMFLVGTLIWGYEFLRVADKFAF